MGDNINGSRLFLREIIARSYEIDKYRGDGIALQGRLWKRSNQSSLELAEICLTQFE